ncbi:hypothetical protein [Nonomuraea aridisoli]|uniref:Uncharacterized protein n=1 Tax=Nonomuraea aridisoli TaxID=2070368 RepID=A0A2W2DSB4_9ACTN|nr:hypothetical protein [Nonomuraea aridisoli]PZG14852.1 hypothetical protein C1J01_25740 [Nonomuraea aridisoli]
MPGWDEEVAATTASEVSRALLDPLRRWSDLAVPSFPAAAEELMAWLADPRAFDKDFHPMAFDSAMQDYDHAAKQGLGTKAKDVLSAELAHVQRVLTSLRAGGWSGDQEPAKSALRTLLGKLDNHEVLQAAWRDLWSKIDKKQTSAEAIAPVRDVFLELARRAGHSLEFGSDFIAILQGVLADGSWAVTAMKSTLGDVLTVEAGQQDGDPLAAAGLTIDERNAICERFLALPAPSSWHVVWLVYEKASMPVMFAELGNISLFSSQYVPNDAQAASAKCSSYARNWTTTDGKVLAEMPHRQGLVNVRVFLPARLYADPVTVARNHVDALVAVGKFHAGIGHGDWRLAEGHTHIGHGSSSERYFRLGADAAQQHLDHQRRSAVFSGMEAFWKQKDGSPSMDDDRLAEAVELLRWWQAAQEQTPLARVIADVRVIETASSRIGPGKWHQHLTRFLKPAWIVHSVHGQLRDTLHDALGGASEGLSPQARERRQTVAAATRRTDDFPWIGLVPGTTRTALTELLDIYPEHHHTRRRLRTLASRLSNHDAFNKWRASLDTRWTHLLDRLVRTRNAITHGGPGTADAVRSVALFASQLSAWEVQLALEAALKNISHEAAHQEFSEADNDLLGKIHRAPTPGDVLHDSAVPSRPPA